MSAPGMLHATVGSYRLADFLGAGGMGEVYRAVDTRSGRVVALKVLTRGEALPALRSRFFHEAHVQAGLSHPNIATLYELLEHEGRLCLAMEYVDGQTLADRVRERGCLPPREALDILRALAGAVDHVHGRGVVHRDLKPTNIRLTASGVVKLLDFGIAKTVSARGVTRTGTVIGTPLYLSPEQLAGGEATARSDLWALGVLLYEMVTGTVPYDAATITELWDRINTGRYASVASVLGGGGDRRMVRSVDRIIGRCLKRDPAARYASAAGLVADVEAALALGPREPRRSPRARWVESAGAVAGRLLPAVERRWAWLTTAAALVGLLAVAAGGPWRTATVRGTPTGSEPSPAAAAASREGPVPAAALQIDVQEGHADVFVNGELRGRTPYLYRGRFGEGIEVELRQPGYRPVKQRLELTQQRVVTLRMDPLPPPARVP